MQTKYLDVDIPEDAKSVMQTLEKAGYQAWIVGGWCRDLFTGRESHDIDICTDAIPDQTIETFKAAGLKMRWSMVGEMNGTIIVGDGEGIEVTTFRKDGAYSDGRRPDTVEFTMSLEDDLSRRDFTCNAMALDLRGNFADPFGGKFDIERGTICSVGIAHDRFQEDALRMMRAIRFAARYGWGISQEVGDAILENAELIRNVSIERITSEFLQIIESDNPEHVLHLFNLNLMNYIAPELRRGTVLLKMKNVDETNVRLSFLFGQEHESLMQYMTFPRVQIKNVLSIGKAYDLGTPSTREEVRQMLSKTGQKVYFQVMRLRKALGQKVGWQQDEAHRISESGECFHLSQLAVNGEDMMSLGLQGRDIRDMLTHLLETVLVAPEMNSQDELIRIAEQAIENGDE